MRTQKKLKLTPEMEKALLAGLIFGAVQPESIDSNEFSVQAQQVHQAVSDLLLAGNAPPLSLPAIALSLTEVHGIPAPAAQAYLESIRATLPTADGAEPVIRKLREQHALLQVANTAMSQLAKGEFKAESLYDALAGTGVTRAPVPLSDEIKDGLPPPPPRLPLRLLPQFTQRIGGGLVGLTVLAGEPAVGKSRVAWQVALDLSSQGTKVVYYDLDNGAATLLDRTRTIFENNFEAILHATQNIYLRDSIRSLDSDLVYITPPALVVVDIFQALPVSQEYEREGLGRWIHRLGALRRRGYHVLVVSEVPRIFYGTPSLGAFKGTGEIEYTADLGLQMIPNNIRGGASIHVVKNRHGELNRCEVATLESTRGLLWREVGEELWAPPS